MPLVLHTLAHSEIGLVRKSNQDSGCVTPSTLFVADGMGGAAAGDLASALSILDLVHVDDTPVSDGQALEVLRGAVFSANNQIAELIAQNPDLDGMGTTICGGIFDGEQMNMVHIGDSRAYLLRKGQLTRLTHDHSYVQSLIDDGRLDERSALHHPHRSLLLRVLNGQPEIKPDFFSTPLQAGDRLTICSDGLCGLVQDPAIAVSLRLPDPDEAMNALINLAHAAGGSDNITIIIADVTEEQPSPGTAPGQPAQAPTRDMADQTQPLTLGQGEPGVTGSAITGSAMSEPAAEPTQRMPHRGRTSAPVQPTLPVSRFITEGLLGAATDQHVVSLVEALREKAEEDLDKESPTTLVQKRGQDRSRRTPRSQSKLTPAQRELQRYTPAPKKSRKGFWIIVLLILLGLGGAGWGVYAYVSHQFFVADSSGKVAIYQGIPGTIAGFDTSKVYETTSISLSDLPISWREKIEATISISGGIDQAHTTVDEITAKSLQCVQERANRPAGTPIPADGC